MSFPFDSFNVEDLHSVDEGVIRHLFPLLDKNATSAWDLLIGHFLGVDHVAHRLGPAHPTMAAKLAQMNDVLTRVVDALDDETLLVVIGDHGMDRKGDHGGDGEHETSAATWIFSKSIPLSSENFNPPLILTPNITFPEATVPHRSIQQIDLVPTLSLLLGLPIPFNNLGTVIPELFGRADGALLEHALRLNANQIQSFFDAYRASPSGGELDGVWNIIQQSWTFTRASESDTPVAAMHAFTRLALASCRSLWAQFNVGLMYVGLFSLALGNLAVWALYGTLGRGAEHWEIHGWPIVTKTGISSALGAMGGAVLSLVLPEVVKIVGAVEACLIGAALASSITVLICTSTKLSLSRRASNITVTLLLHAVAFFSNSFTFWEDRILNFLLLTSLVPFVSCALTSPLANRHLRNRVLSFSALFAVCVRLVGISTVCREEQQPYCHVTFYASSSLPSPPALVLILALPTSFAFPSFVRRILGISRSDKGVAPVFLEWGLRTVLLSGSVCWIFEWLESTEVISSEWSQGLRAARTLVARSAMIMTLLGGGVLWWFSPLCLDLHQLVDTSGKKQMQVIGFANAYGSSFLLFTLIPFSLLFVATQLTGQITLVLSMVALLALLEVVDSTRDIRLAGITASSPGTPAVSGGEGVSIPIFAEVLPLALLALHTFYATGHQSTMPSIQWKTAFLLTPTLSYPISPMLVVLNTFGPQLIFAAAVPLLAVWNVAPISTARAHLSESSNNASPTGQSDSPPVSVSSRVLVSSLRASLGISLYFSMLLLSSAISSAWLRRHLMVWKVFAPRFMIAGGAIVFVDLGVLMGVTLGVGQVIQKVQKFLGIVLKPKSISM